MAPAYRLQLFGSVVEGVQERTASGAVLSLAAYVVIASLVLYEMRNFFTVTIVNHLGVDDGDRPFGSGRISAAMMQRDTVPLNIHMTFAHLACDAIDLHMDATRGERESVNHVEFRPPTPLELAGWAPAKATPEMACTLDGRLTVGKVAANFRIVAGTKHPSAMLAALNPIIALNDKLQTMAHLGHINISHKVHSLHFGDKLPGLAAPLDGVVQHLRAGQQHYTLKIIPTLNERHRRPVLTNQYSLSEQFIEIESVFARGNTLLGTDPGVYFTYDVFPVMIQIVEQRPSLAHFVTSICAIVGGVFAISSMVDGLVFNAAKAFKKAD